MNLLCCLLKQYKLTIHLLRQDRRNPRISSCTALEGTFDFNKTPFDSPGCKVVIHENTYARRNWALHGSWGWYIGPSKWYYMCH